MTELLNDVHDEDKGQKEDSRGAAQAATWQLLDPCPACGKRPHDAPEGVNAFTGDPFWTQDYCFACGYRPDSTNVNPLTQRFQDFVNFTNESIGNMRNERGFSPPQSSQEAEAMRASLAQMQAELAELRAERSAQNESTLVTPPGDPNPSPRTTEQNGGNATVNNAGNDPKVNG